MVELSDVNRSVVGSSPTCGAILHKMIYSSKVGKTMYACLTNLVDDDKILICHKSSLKTEHNSEKTFVFS